MFVQTCFKKQFIELFKLAKMGLKNVFACDVQLLGRTIRVDHVQDYKPPKDSKKADEELVKLQNEGCAPVAVVTDSKKEIKQGN